MTIMPSDLRTFIVGSTSVTSLIATRCHYNKAAPQSTVKPFVWFRVTNDTEPLTMDGVGGMHQSFIDIECVGANETSAQAIADAVKGRLHGYKGTMGNSSAKAMFLDDKDDNYIPYSTEGEDGAHVVAYTLTLWYST